MKGGQSIIEKKKPGRKKLPVHKKRKEVKAYLLPDMIEWYFSQGDGLSFTEILENIAKGLGYKPKEADDNQKEGTAHERSRPHNQQPLMCETALI